MRGLCLQPEPRGDAQTSARPPGSVTPEPRSRGGTGRPAGDTHMGSPLWMYSHRSSSDSGENFTSVSS